MDDRAASIDADAIAGRLGAQGAVSHVLPGFEHRPGQVEMVRAVADAFNSDGVLVVEAGTGVGKSLAYGLPAAAWALATGERVVISSATINLQEQLVGKDLPLVGEVLGEDLRVVLVKGRANYLCRRRLRDLTRQRILVEPGEVDEHLALLAEWADRSADGSRSDLPEPVPEEIWSTVCSDADACLGRRCPARNECFFARARREAERAQLVVANHHLLFADLALRRVKDNWDKKAVLPPFGRVILDEAHEVEGAASSFFGVRITRAGTLRILSRLKPPRKKEAGLLGGLAREVAAYGGPLAAGRSERLTQEIEGGVTPLVEQARLAYIRAFDTLVAFAFEESASSGDARLRLTGDIHGREGWTAVAESFREAAGTAEQLARDTGRLIERLVDFDQEEGRLAEARAVVARTEDLAAGTRHWIAEEPDGSVRWLEADRKTGKRAGMLSAPLNVSELMNETLYDNVGTVVLTSATLSVGGSFDFLCSRIGVDLQPEERRRLLLVESPFDFSEQVRLGLPTDLPTPDQPHFERALPEAVFQAATASGGRALVLFTAWGLMSRVHELTRDRLEDLGLEVLCQGQAPRDRLLGRFRESESSVLFGTDSFWQGVDVIGPALRNVIITRLPFDVPDEPLTQARMEAVEAGGKSAFSAFMLPRAVLKLKQGFGRLIRSRTDWGAVVVMDTRLLGRSYGSRFLRSLPPARQVVGTLGEVCDAVAGFFYEHGMDVPERVSVEDFS